MAKVSNERKINNKIECVYLINKIIGKPLAYVGSTINKNYRFKVYQKGLKKTYVERSITKYGWDSFQKIEINVNAKNEKELRAWEGFYIKLFGTYKYDNPKFGMNIVKNPVLAISKDPLVAKKISDSKKGKKMSDKQKESIRNATKGKINLGIKRPYLSERNKILKTCIGRTGEKHPMSKKILYITENKVFESIKDAADFFNISRPGMRYRIKVKPQLFKYL